MKVLIADKFEQSGCDGLNALGCEVSFQPDLKDEPLVDAIAKEQPDVLIVRGTKVTEPTLAAGPLKLVVRSSFFRSAAYNRSGRASGHVRKLTSTPQASNEGRPKKSRKKAKDLWKLSA